jgi:hypothetical protein
MNKKSKPDYTKFMRKPMPFNLGAADQNPEEGGRKTRQREEVPDAEILLTPRQRSLLEKQAVRSQPQSPPEQILDAEIIFSSQAPVGVSPVVAVTDESLRPTEDVAIEEEELDYTPVVEAPPLAALILVVLALVALML